jgi:hypothetical protein
MAPTWDAWTPCISFEAAYASESFESIASGARCHFRGQPLNFLIASSVTGVKKFTRLPSGSRKRMDRLPHGIVVGCCTHSLTIGWSRWYSLSTSSTLNSMMTVWLSAGRVEPRRTAESSACGRSPG